VMKGLMVGLVLSALMWGFMFCLYAATAKY